MRFKTPYAADILAYLARHPGAQDTLDGILHWWLMERLIEIHKPKVEASVDELVDRGYLLVVGNERTGRFYRFNPDSAGGGA